jgi:peptidoglycan/xylan/chitin deacetylase (PgdA/CDA1 family)
VRRLALVLLLAAANATVARGAEPSRQIAITFDDLPQAGPAVPLARAQAMTGDLLAALAKHRVPATVFVNEQKLYAAGEADARIGLLEKWLDAGHELGNHTFSHPSLHTTPLQEYEENVVRGETVTRILLARRGKTLRYFRHPFLQTGPTLEARASFEGFLAQRKYTVAPVTVDDADYVFAALYADALTKGDRALAAKLRDAYVAYLPVMFDFFETLAQDVVGRPIRHVLLLHANELNAASFDALASGMEARGYRFVSLAEALEDPAYALPDRYAGVWGCSWIERWLFTKTGSMRVKEEPDPPDWVMVAYKARGAR